MTADKQIMVAMGQMLVTGGAVEENLDRAVRLIHEAGERQADILVLPECLDLGWTHPSARELAQPIPGPSSERLCQAAKSAGIHVVAGLTERAGDRIYNAALLIAPDGEILRKHRKINVLTIAQDIYAIGDSLAVTETSLGTIGLLTCADNFPESLVLGHSLARMGAQIILSPSAWAVDGDHDNQQKPYGEPWIQSYTTLAKTYAMPVVGVSNVGWITGGVWEGRKCIGCSLAVGHDGQIIRQGAYGEAAEELVLIPVTLTPRTVTGTAIDDMLNQQTIPGAAMKSFAELTRAGQVRRLRPLAEKVLTRYAFTPAHLRLLSPEVNTTFRVDTTTGQIYVLRINLPGEGGRSLRQIRSELAWLEALNRDTDLAVSNPIPTYDGETIVTAEVPGVPEPRHCVLFEWMPGRNVGKKVPPRTAARMGEFMARLHDHADTFTPPDDFMDNRLDKAWVFGAPAVIYTDPPSDLFPKKRQALYREIADRVQVIIDRLYADPSGLRFLHADMHLGNVKLHQGELQVFDFDDSMWCYPVQDIAISLYYMPDDPRIREAFQQAYTRVRPWPEDYAGQIEMLLVARHLDLISWVMAQNDPLYYPWLSQWLAKKDKQLEKWLAETEKSRARD